VSLDVGCVCVVTWGGVLAGEPADEPGRFGGALCYLQLAPLAAVLLELVNARANMNTASNPLAVSRRSRRTATDARHAPSAIQALGLPTTPFSRRQRCCSWSGERVVSMSG
jgi:hypothetical protein